MTAISPVSSPKISINNPNKRLAKDISTAAVLGSVVGAASTAAGLLYTAKKSKLKIRDMVKMFDNFGQFLKSTTLIPNVLTGLLTASAVTALTSKVNNRNSNK